MNTRLGSSLTALFIACAMFGTAGSIAAAAPPSGSASGSSSGSGSAGSSQPSSPPGPDGHDSSASALYNHPGPHQVLHTQQLVDCKNFVYGQLVDASVHSPMKCTNAFPAGVGSPVGVQFYYPADLDIAHPAPVVIFTGGILSNPGNYAYLAQLWASYGFVVANSYDFFNSLPEVPVIGFAGLLTQVRNPASPLYGKVDLGRVTLAGHSAGGAAEQTGAALAPALERLLDPELHVNGFLAIEPGPLAVGALLSQPLLVLTGEHDTVVPAQTWPRWLQYGTAFRAPAYFGVAKGAEHTTPLLSGDANPFGGISVAWLLHLAKLDPAADDFFTGAHWRFEHDPDFIGVIRNKEAGH